jgi:hypothetical protein
LHGKEIGSNYYLFPENLRKIIIRIENAIPTEKHPQATFLTPNAMWSVIPQLSIIMARLSRPPRRAEA